MKTTLRLRLTFITLAALAVAWLWARQPIFTPLFYLHPSTWTQADLVRHLWHFRLVQPERVSRPPQYDYLRWAQAETLARLSFVFLGWFSGSAWLLRRNPAGRNAELPFWIC